MTVSRHRTKKTKKRRSGHSVEVVEIFVSLENEPRYLIAAVIVARVLNDSNNRKHFSRLKGNVS